MKGGNVANPAAIVDAWNFRLHTNPGMVKVNNNHLWGSWRSLNQESDDTPPTASLNETVSFGYRKRGLQAHRAVVVINPYQLYAGFDCVHQS